MPSLHLVLNLEGYKYVGKTLENTNNNFILDNRMMVFKDHATLSFNTNYCFQTVSQISWN